MKGADSMKKEYLEPEMIVKPICFADIVCTSPGAEATVGGGTGGRDDEGYDLDDDPTANP